MSNYIDHLLSARVSTQFRRIITGKTDIVPLANGRENRNAAWQFKKMQYAATFNMLTAAAQAEVVSAYYAANGQLLLFRFRDYGDYQVAASPLNTAAVIGTRTPLQLTKRYTFGSVFADRKIQAAASCVVSSGGSEVAGAFDGALGTFTPADVWGADVYTWSGTFDVWVRFNSDELDVTMVSLDVSTTDVSLIEAEAYSG